ncbi:MULTISPECIES: bifunctional isocitrate dehydrogenase kinase/phosphatase [Pantoea]|jgi:isocitrate dehydrogenase kinase/phosphatase|uniref:Isocitrate dehydrogenase kinase/phosphatase n=1 Tax=Pantoea brenneri TaxID=472694 RepID=A0A7Y6NGT8_9GAMM|nr:MULTISPECIES: bifunctional isocitrate dehydrogenase kinase/phosphatase [Pantoea]MBZ6396962.1 bifunctional isocitrate dehydrogenase kinase/phosphatase [Pantoea sp.]MBZ6440182.1 bifunctional isocitrate dehydrogenase kinase/phosphatase [Pantoea sp.]MDU7865729.1 bifunctional isocitrate dehydrogenase kinase/phosphatase [Pantoea sp.]NUY43340.1 bifunctional isocitrate dehydrogenase kinase/phosphatase [Pantoea brenneri]NUY50877.1 bifunctional isocitrate dehydrogenase kinase/phosphatase [Pantoea bre
MPPRESLIAHTILQGFDAQYGRFLDITAGAQQRFEQAEWQAVQQAMKARIHLYDHHVGLVADQLRVLNGAACWDEAFWLRVKGQYESLLPGYPRYEIAESFFNSVYCRLHGHADLQPERLFIFSSQSPSAQISPLRPLARSYQPQQGWQALIGQVLRDLPLTLPWQHRERDIGWIVRHLQTQFPQLERGWLEVSCELFYRNKTAWLVARLHLPDAIRPCLLPIQRSATGELWIDTCLTDVDDASIVFGFARAYFMVYAPMPAALVAWLQPILPGKTLAERYMAIGCQKHGKTESYREYLQALEQSEAEFEIAPGIRGMVMLVFTLPGFDRVFKVIKDRFAPQKEVTEAQVRACYQQVKEHDRVGRMADTQEFEQFALPLARISPELLAELNACAAEKLKIEGDRLIIRHLWLERRMQPLNLYLAQASAEQRRQAIEEYGNAIRQLAAANIFPGDMLFKNFGITRHGRVVFYDYDEIRPMQELHFREVPAARYEEDELSAEPWYSVGPDDVFPETFRYALCSDAAIGALLLELHPEIFEARWWRAQQQRIAGGHVEEVIAWRQAQRFCVRYATEAVSDHCTPA